MQAETAQTEPGIRPGVLIIDDYFMVREAIAALLERAGIPVLGGVTHGAEAIQVSGELRPAVALIDLCKPLLSGLSTAIALQCCSPKTKRVLLGDEDTMREAPPGMAGYITKRASADLVDGIRHVQRNHTYFSPGLSPSSFQGDRKDSDPRRWLTAREWQLLQMITEGKSTKEISAALQVTPNTARSHRANLMQKLEVHNVASLVRMAARWGW